MEGGERDERSVFAKDTKCTVMLSNANSISVADVLKHMDIVACLSESNGLCSTCRLMRGDSLGI